MVLTLWKTELYAVSVQLIPLPLQEKETRTSDYCCTISPAHISNQPHFVRQHAGVRGHPGTGALVARNFGKSLRIFHKIERMRIIDHDKKMLQISAFVALYPLWKKFKFPGSHRSASQTKNVAEKLPISDTPTLVEMLLFAQSFLLILASDSSFF